MFTLQGQQDGLLSMAVRLNSEMGIKCAIKRMPTKTNEHWEKWELYANDNSWSIEVFIYQNKEVRFVMYDAPVVALLYLIQAIHAYDIAQVTSTFGGNE